VDCGIAAAEDKRGSLASHHKSVDTGSDDEGVYPGIVKLLLCITKCYPKIPEI
jgi:hypothetical protein